MLNLKKFFGPSTLVAAAFIGPGTLTTCTIVGVETGYTLIWAMLFSIAATIFLQEMSARLGFITQRGLGEAFNKQFKKGISRYLIFFLIIGAILVGNAAYEAGNIAGGILGFELVVGEFTYWPLVLGALCFGILYSGKYKWIEGILITLVIVMSISFLLTAIVVKPDLSEIIKGVVPQGIEGSNLLLIMALIGTTVVPYNLFLHASTISKKWKEGDSLNDLRLENAISIILGGLISLFIIITAASSASMVEEVSNAKDLAIQLEPLFGNAAKWLMGIGLIAAGVSSALTAPLAAAYTAKGLFGWSKGESDNRFRMIWMGILLIGVVVAMSGIRLVTIIKFAQVANALMLPLLAVYLVYLCNSKDLMGTKVNGMVTNFFGGLVIVVTISLCIKTLYGMLY